MAASLPSTTQQGTGLMHFCAEFLLACLEFWSCFPAWTSQLWPLWSVSLLRAGGAAGSSRGEHSWQVDGWMQGASQLPGHALGFCFPCSGALTAARIANGLLLSVLQAAAARWKSWTQLSNYLVFQLPALRGFVSPHWHQSQHTSHPDSAAVLCALMGQAAGPRTGWSCFSCRCSGDKWLLLPLFSLILAHKSRRKQAKVSRSF